MIDGKLCSTNIELVICDDDTESDHDECLSDLVIWLASDYQKVVIPREPSLGRIDNDNQTVHPKHTYLPDYIRNRVSLEHVKPRYNGIKRNSRLNNPTPYDSPTYSSLTPLQHHFNYSLSHFSLASAQTYIGRTSAILQPCFNRTSTEHAADDYDDVDADGHEI